MRSRIASLRDGALHRSSTSMVRATSSRRARSLIAVALLVLLAGAAALYPLFWQPLSFQTAPWLPQEAWRQGRVAGWLGVPT